MHTYTCNFHKLQLRGSSWEWSESFLALRALRSSEAANGPNASIRVCFPPEQSFYFASCFSWHAREQKVILILQLIFDSFLALYFLPCYSWERYNIVYLNIKEVSKWLVTEYALSSWLRSGNCIYFCTRRSRSNLPQTNRTTQYTIKV